MQVVLCDKLRFLRFPEVTGLAHLLLVSQSLIKKPFGAAETELLVETHVF